MTKRFFPLLSLVLVAALLLTGCGVMAAPAPESAPLRVEYTIWEGDYTLLIAQEKGFFEKHGVKVEPVFYETFSKALPDLSAKKIDAGLFAIGDTLLVSRYTDVKAVMMYDSGGASTLVARKGISNVLALRGKRVGVPIGTYSELYIRNVLQEAGLTVKDVTLVDVDPEEVPSRLSEDIEAGYVWSPLDQEAQKNGHKVLVTSSAVDKMFPDLVVFRADVVEERPEDVRAFIAAWFEALEYRLAHPEESNAMIARITNQTVEDLASSGKVRLYNQADNQLYYDRVTSRYRSIFTAARVNLNFMTSRGNLTVAPDLETILDPSFLP